MKTNVLNLSKDFNPIRGYEIGCEMLKFSGGELHIKLDNNVDYHSLGNVTITHRVACSDDFIAILIAKNALELNGIKDVDLVMPYIPYARQDRKCFNGESFTLKVFANLLNSANFNSVHVIDSHSDVAPALIDNCINHSNEEYVRCVIGKFKEKPILISPDAGSNKKSNKLSVSLGLDLVKCDKMRDTGTGDLSGFEVFTDTLKGRDCLIVDDICDGGGTFIGLAKELKEKGAGSISLFVTHGIFSKGADIFKGVIDNLYCTNSFSELSNSNINQLNIKL